MKVLIISHNPITTYHNMGKTLLSLFSGFNKDKICQIYIYPNYPDVECCSSYYRVTDKDILRAFFGLRYPGDEVDANKIHSGQQMYENPSDEYLYGNVKNKTPIMCLLRDFMWMISGWYNKNFKKWLNKEKPDCIFVAPGEAKFLHNIALKISKKRNIPIVTYICDEYYFMESSDKSLLGIIQLYLLKNKYKKLLEKTSHIVTICNELKKIYSEEFKIPTTTIMTGSNYEVSDSIKICDNPKVISYFGNIRCNRHLSIAEVGKKLERINKELSTNYLLKIFTREKNQEILSIFDGISTIKLCGFVTGEEFDETLRNSDLLLHVEAFDEKSINLVKHSVSTKIADSLAIGVPLVAYGPKCVASMRHLIDNDCAFIATVENELSKVLLTAFNNKNEAERVVRNAIKVAAESHCSRLSSIKLKNIIEGFYE